MKIKAQNGEIAEVFEVTMKGKEISCCDPKDKRKKVILGVYADLARTSMVCGEIYAASHNGSDYYEMPEN